MKLWRQYLAQYRRALHVDVQVYIPAVVFRRQLVAVDFSRCAATQGRHPSQPNHTHSDTTRKKRHKNTPLNCLFHSMANHQYVPYFLLLAVNSMHLSVKLATYGGRTFSWTSLVQQFVIAFQNISTRLITIS